LRAKTDFCATSAPIARPKRMAHSTAFLVEHRQHAGQGKVDRAGLRVRCAPKAVEAPEKILETVASCACVSMPITTSH
jgi:hypothetical protein